MDAARGERLDARRCLGLLGLLTLARTAKTARPPAELLRPATIPGADRHRLTVQVGRAGDWLIVVLVRRLCLHRPRRIEQELGPCLAGTRVACHAIDTVQVVRKSLGVVAILERGSPWKTNLGAMGRKDHGESL
jgi:hypothetical protein